MNASTHPGHQTARPAAVESDLIQLHAQAHNALSTALHYLQRIDCNPDHLKTATARAVRAATLLKRACAAHEQAGVQA